jgi:hypothetical protein
MKELSVYVLVIQIWDLMAPSQSVLVFDRTFVALSFYYGTVLLW